MQNPMPRAPWHFWLVVGLSLIWSGLAAFDYVMTVVQGEAYMAASGMTAAQIAYFSHLPLWVTTAWTFSVWGGVLGTLALLSRHPMAATLFFLSVAGTAGYVLWTCVLSDGVAAMGGLWFMPLIVCAATLFLAGYARRLAR